MTKLSLTLKSIIPEERKSKLLESIRKFNGVIDRKRKKYRAIDKNKNLQIEFLNIFHGILIPFSKNNDWPFNSNLVR